LAVPHQAGAVLGAVLHLVGVLTLCIIPLRPSACCGYCAQPWVDPSRLRHARAGAGAVPGLTRVGDGHCVWPAGRDAGEGVEALLTVWLSARPRDAGCACCLWRLCLWP